MNTLFSVLIANYNNGKYLSQCLDSIFNQTYSNWEIIIVDDGSTDNSHSIYQEIKSDNRIKVYYNNQNRGCGYTKRRCAELAQGEIIGYVDPDDIIPDNAIQKMIDAHASNPLISMVYSNYYLCNENLQILNDAKSEEYHEALFIIGRMPNPLTTFKKSSYLKTTGINADFKRAIDRDLVLKLEEVGEVLHIDDYLYYYRTNPNSISMDKNRYRSTYWTWMARFDACGRRGWDKEDMFDMVSKALQPSSVANPVLRSWDYRIGNFILTPLRWFMRLVNRYKK